MKRVLSPRPTQFSWERWTRIWEGRFDYAEAMLQNHRLNQPSYTALDFLFWFSVAVYIALEVAVVAKYVVPMVLR